MFLALQFVNPLAAMGPTFYVLWHNLWNAVQMLIHDRRQEKKIRMRKQIPHRHGNSGHTSGQ